jgi:hypothetical protein
VDWYKAKKRRNGLIIFFFFADPSRWSRDDVTRWMSWTTQQFNALTVQPVAEWTIDGSTLLHLTEAQFKQKFLQVRIKLFRQTFFVYTN